MMTLKWVPIIVSRASSFIRPGCLIPVIGAGFRRTSPFILHPFSIAPQLRMHGLSVTTSRNHLGRRISITKVVQPHK
jgi:hypothetical protein